MSKQKKPMNEKQDGSIENENIEVIAEDDELPVVEEEEVVIDPMEQKENEIAALKEELNKAKTDIARAYADTDNMKKRLQKETDMAKKYRFQSAALEFLPILDSMNLALSQVPENEEANNFVKGFEMIRTQLENALQNEGVKEIDAQDKPLTTTRCRH